MNTVYVCKRCGDRVVPARPDLVPLKHYVKDANGVGGYWCDGGYEREEPSDG